MAKKKKSKVGRPVANNGHRIVSESHTQKASEVYALGKFNEEDKVCPPANNLRHDLGLEERGEGP